MKHKTNFITKCSIVEMVGVALVVALAVVFSGIPQLFAAYPDPSASESIDPSHIVTMYAADMNDWHTDPDLFDPRFYSGALWDYFPVAEAGGTGVFDTYLAVKESGNSVIERGFNQGGKGDYDEDDSKTHALPLSEVPIVEIDMGSGPVMYREFCCDVNEVNDIPDQYLSMEVLQIWQSESDDLCGQYSMSPAYNFTVAEPDLIYDLDWDYNYTVILDYGVNTGSGKSDYKVFVPDDWFNDKEFVIMVVYHGNLEVYDPVTYAEYGASAGFEEWGVRVINDECCEVTLHNVPAGGDLGCNPTPPVCDTGVTATDGCDAALAVTCTPGPITGDCNKSQTFTYSASDLCGNTATANVTYTWKDDTTPPTVVTDLAISTATDNCITLTWTAPGDDGNMSSASQYDIRYSASNITEANWDSATQCTGEPSPQPAGSSESFVVTGLSPETTYHFALKTADEVPNWSGLSNVASGTTSSKAGGSVSGVVRETDGVTSIGGAKTFAYDSTQGTFVSGVESADDGTYTIIGLPAGSYKVKATSSGYVDEWYQEETSSDKADHVHVTAGTDTSDIDFSLSRLYDTPIGGNATVIDPYSGVTMVFAHVSEAGVTSISPSEENPGGNITGFKFLGKYYDIETTAVYTGPITVTIVYDDADVTGKEDNLKLFHFVDGEPQRVPDAVVDTINNTITGVVDTLSWFAIAEPIGCFIATAAYGTQMTEEIQILREFRDEYLLTSLVGQALVGLYYRVSPPIAEFITEHPSLKAIVRVGLLPAVAMSTVAVNTTSVEKAAIIGLLALVSVAVAIHVTKRQGRGQEYT